ncbi:gibberellin 2-beta-dioxygenase 1-like [Coffea arabica]|uniref:Gibberellin 2-beta-dioxygenase 1-like n=1 Tax=Coffea arabica TaxID=13443 RepID=A0A6P6W6Z0_COFAR|nr:gibberellin 2-beta-dioxygenase 1-like [Coffea arabica]XP_027110775.1 gibberellin 2-beta-dioxygenase 1-like [Coffea arabica]
MASSAHEHHHHLPNPYATTAAPPPTPSTQPNEAADALSCLLHRLPPNLTLSLPTRHSSPPATAVATTPPLISLSDPPESLRSNLLSAGSQFGFFQLTNHSIPSQLATSAESDALSLFNLSPEEKQLHFPQNWPLGYDAGDDDDEESTISGESSVCLDSACSSESTELNLTSLREFTADMAKLGLQLVEELSCAFGFDNPARPDPNKVCSLMWISDSRGTSSNKPVLSGRIYPYAIGLQYQIRCQKYSILADSGWTAVSPNVDTILATLGDIAQVWSNGKIKKARGRAGPNLSGANNSDCVSMTLLITLPADATVSPLLPKLDSGNGEERDPENDCSSKSAKEERIFNSFSFEDYAWRIYHERLHSKDPLLRYRAQLQRPLLFHTSINDA